MEDVSVTLIYFVKLLILPPASLLILALIGLVFRRRSLGIPLLATALCLLILLSLPIVSCNLARLWERYPSLKADRIQQLKPQALVVVGGGLAKNREYDAEFTLNERSLLRLRYAAKLAKAFRLPVLVSGGQVFGSEQGPEHVSEASVMAQVLKEEFNIPVDWQEQKSRNTEENARFSHEILQKDGIDTIVLVTQAYHMPRALHEFAKEGFKVLPAPTAFIAGHSDKSFDLSIFDFLPSANALRDSFLLAHESLGMLWYAIRY